MNCLASTTSDAPAPAGEIHTLTDGFDRTVARQRYPFVLVPPPTMPSGPTGAAIVRRLLKELARRYRCRVEWQAATPQAAVEPTLASVQTPTQENGCKRGSRRSGEAGRADVAQAAETAVRMSVINERDIGGCTTE